MRTKALARVAGAQPSQTIRPDHPLSSSFRLMCRAPTTRLGGFPFGPLTLRQLVGKVAAGEAVAGSRIPCPIYPLSLTREPPPFFFFFKKKKKKKKKKKNN